MTNAILRGKPDAGNPHVRFDEGEVASAKPRRGSLLYNMIRKSVHVCAMACLSMCVGAAEDGDVTILTNGYRQFVSGSQVYQVETQSVKTEPSWVTTSLLFAFDCSQTNGWMVADDGTVTKVPSRVGTRYLTVGEPDDLVEDAHYYGAYGIYYSTRLERAILPGHLVLDPDLNALCLDFGEPESRRGMFFNAISAPWTSGNFSGERQNVLTNIGSVVGVYRSNMGGEMEGGGNLLSGRCFQRFAGYGQDNEGRTQNGVGLRFPIVKGSAFGDLKYGSIWTGLTKNAPEMAKWTGTWQIVAANPSAATLTAYGVGMGNIDAPDESVSSGGQRLAELLVFDRVLTETETRELVIYLTHKWLNCDSDGYNGRANISWLALGSQASWPSDDSVTVTLDVPAGETLAIGRLNGGRGDGTALPTVEKTGAGTMTVGESADFGGQLAVRGGTLKMEKPKPVPAFEDLAPYLTLHLDPSDATSLTVDDGGSVSAWANTAAYAVTSLETNRVVQTDPTRCPTRIQDALGAGLDVLDFGRYGASGKYMAFQPTRAYQTIVAVVDARMYGGGNVMSHMFRHCRPATLDNATPWEVSPLSLLLDTARVYVSDYADGKNGTFVPVDTGDVWVNGHRVEAHVAGNEVPSWQVVAWRVPCAYVEGWLLGAASATQAGGLRLGEVLGWGGALSDEAIRDAVAYLMKKWLGRVPAGYADDLDVPALQNLTIGGGSVVDVAEGATLTVGSLATDGPAVKTGAGILAIASGADLAGGLEVRGGRLATVSGPDVASACEVASNPSLRLDASDESSILFVDTSESDATNFIWNWSDSSHRIAALRPSEQGSLAKKPYLNAEADALCNGLPTIDFGGQHDGWDNGTGTTEARTLGLSRTLTNIRSVYMVYGSQAGGGQPLGCATRNNIRANIEGIQFANFQSLDFLRAANSLTQDIPLFAASSSNVKNGELWINGERQERVDQWIPSGGYDLVELHTAGGCMANALGHGYGDYVQGGFRLGEIIVFERPLSEREKTATRNYLLKKWFGKPDAELAALPSKAGLATLSGDITYGAGSELVFTVENGTITNPIALSGTLTFEEGARISVQGFDENVRLGDRLVLGTVEAVRGLENVTFDFGGRTFAADVSPILTFRRQRLVVRFGTRGTLLLIR